MNFGKVKIARISMSRRQRRQPTRLSDSVVDSTIGVREALLGAEDFRSKVYCSVLDCFIAEMNRRFSSEYTVVMKAIQACTPG